MEILAQLKQNTENHFTILDILMWNSWQVSKLYCCQSQHNHKYISGWSFLGIEKVLWLPTIHAIR